MASDPVDAWALAMISLSEYTERDMKMVSCYSCGGQGGDLSGPCWDCQGSGVDQASATEEK